MQRKHFRTGTKKRVEHLCETKCLITGAGGRKQADVPEGALFNTLAIYPYILSLISGLIFKTAEFF